MSITIKINSLTKDYGNGKGIFGFDYPLKREKLSDLWELTEVVKQLQCVILWAFSKLTTELRN